MNTSFVKNKLEGIFVKLLLHQVDLREVILFRDWYGETTFFIKLTPYLWLIPFIVIVILLVVFKRAKLYGYTQKYLVTIMLLDLIYTLLTGIRDGSLSFLKMDYGYIEHKICRLLLTSFNLQTNLHGTSIWVKCLMSFTQYIFVAFPLKCKVWRLKRCLMLFAVLHVTFLSLTFIQTSSMPLKGVWTFQVPDENHKTKPIQACSMDNDSGYYESFFFSIFQNYGTFFLYVYYLVIPTVLDIILIFFLTLLMKKHLKILSVLAPKTGKRCKTKYLILIKLNIILGVSFILQEVPLFTYATIMLTSSDIPVIFKAQGMYNTIMTISFVIGKPLDLVIYASLSDAFRREFSHFFKNGKRSEQSFSSKNTGKTSADSK